MPARPKTNRYFDLMEIFPPRPIRSARDMSRAQKIVNELLDRDALDKDERDYLEVLGTLIEAYEEEHEPMPDVSDAATLSHLIEARDVTQRAVAEGASLPESTISDLLAGRREFNRWHIEKLAAYFKVSPVVFFKSQTREGIEA
jgi:HTH-type transcriptional regulator/antitoxin HigA